MPATALISEFEARRVARMLDKLFLGRLKRGEAFEVSGDVDASWVGVRWVLQTPDAGFAYAVDARVARRSGNLRDDDLKELLYDLLGHLFDGYVKGALREPFTGPEWEEIDFVGHRVWLRGQERSPRAEAQADALLDAGARADAMAARRAARDPAAACEPDPSA